MKLLPTASMCGCALAIGLAAPIAAVAAPAATSSAAMTSASSQDTTWLNTSIQTDLAEIQGGKLAETASSNPAVLKLAKTVVASHTKLMTAADKLARQNDIAVPQSPSAAQQRVAAKLKTETGKAFDVGYSTSEIAGHEKSITQTKAELSNGSMASFKSAAHVALPMLQMHLRLAEAALKAANPATPAK